MSQKQAPAQQQTASRRRNVTRLGAGKMFQVMTEVKENFAAANCCDEDFAAHLTEKLGFPVSESSIRTARDGFGIPSYREALAARPPEDPLDRIVPLEAWVAALEASVANLEARVAQLERILANVEQYPDGLIALKTTGLRIGE
jgi:hypothetical protein